MLHVFHDEETVTSVGGLWKQYTVGRGSAMRGGSSPNVHIMGEVFSNRIQF